MSNIPNEFCCPITLDIMKNPVTGDDGHTYEEAEIVKCLSSNGFKSPMTRAPMRLDTLRPNYALKSQIDRFMAENNISNSLIINKFTSEEIKVNCIKQENDSQKYLLNFTPPHEGERKPIVLIVILDNSGSMGKPACNVNETNGKVFTRMDLCKHTLRTIAGMLKDDDILCLITFSTEGKLVMNPTNMNTNGKNKLDRVIANIHPDSQTNIWDGIRIANKIACKDEFKESNIVSVLLTDGIPNVDPPRGIIESYKMLEKPENLSTFGFGYELDSRLLNGISQVGSGIFGFIPDYSMVATVFINWTASVLSTCSKNIQVEITYDDNSTESISTGLIQFGQSKDFIIGLKTSIKSVKVNGINIEIKSDIIPEFNMAQNDLLNEIKFAIENRGVHKFNELYNKYKNSSDKNIIEIIKDIKPDGEDQGQVYMAPKYFEKWGKHYLRASYQAQKNKMCMNFKDPGLQIYGGKLFHQIQNEGDEMFSNLPSLTPSGNVTINSVTTPTTGTTNFNMASVFHNPSGGCFQAKCPVLMSDKTTKEIQNITSGDYVETLDGPAKVIALVICGSKLKAQPMCQLTEKLWITPWHPVIYKSKWEFPSDIVPMVDRQINTVYNLVLEKGHIINIDGFNCVTLGHSFKEEKVKHSFFGSNKVIQTLMKCSGWEEGKPTFKNLKAIKDENDLIIDWIDNI